MALLLGILALLCTVTHALPLQDDATECNTIVPIVIIPTTTVTIEAPHVVTVTATTPKDLGTYTSIERISKTTTLPETLSMTQTICTGEGTITPTLTITSYSTPNSPPTTNLPKRQATSALPPPRQSPTCTTISTRTLTSGEHYTTILTNSTSTYTQHTEFTLTTITKTSTGFTAYVIATATATKSTICGPTASADDPLPTATTTITRDARCAPSAIVSSDHSREFGLSWLSTHISHPGATFNTATSDAGACCQLCVDAYRCANSAWDVRSGECRLIFLVDGRRKEGEGEGEKGVNQVCDGSVGLYAYYRWGPVKPMEGGSGWWVGSVCGRAEVVSDKPDDGS